VDVVEWTFGLVERALDLLDEVGCLFYAKNLGMSIPSNLRHSNWFSPGCLFIIMNGILNQYERWKQLMRASVPGISKANSPAVLRSWRHHSIVFPWGSAAWSCALEPSNPNPSVPCARVVTAFWRA
jgi:hypothetical protein